MRTCIAGLLLTAVILGSGAAATAQLPVTVEIRDFAFWPRDTVVAVGTVVRWANLDEAPHQIAMTGGQPGSSSLIEPGKDHVFTFKERGQFIYRCCVHPTMLGVVMVQAP
jgi:plastocyanin